MTFLRRLGPGPHAGGLECVALSNCPDILELEDGDFAAIGEDITERARPNLIPTAGCGPGEAIIRIPRKLLIQAKRDIPDAV